MKIKLPFLLPILLLILSSCEGFFGKKTDAAFIDVPIYIDKQVAYVPVQPVWDGFVNPVDVVAGFDELVYVADAGTEELICFDQAGHEMGRFSVPGITSFVQDRSLDILAIGSTDTLGYTLSTLYRIELKGATGYGLDHAVIEKKIIHPFYFKVTPPSNAMEASVRFTSIGLRADNSYYLVRTGPSNSTLQFGGPDDAVLWFGADDVFISPITIQTATGFFTDYFKSPFAITTFVQPPQSPFVSTAGDFIITQLGTNVTLKVQYVSVSETENGVDFTIRQLATGDTAKAGRFLYDPYRFAYPGDVCVTGDGTSNLFVVDGEKDSLFQFTTTGLEGIKPPPGSSQTKYIRTSFGGTGTSLTQFNNPSGVSYANRIVYVADAGNKRVLRFRLTTDFD